MYYIYHIPGIKIGCTDNVERRIEQQGYSNYEIIEQHFDIYDASNRELYLQKKYGYKIDKIPYFKSVEQWGAKAGTKGGKNAQKTLKESSLGLYSKDNQLRKQWSKLGNDAIKKKYGKEYYSNIAKLSNGAENGKKYSSKPIIQYDKNNNFIKEYKSIKDASRETGISWVAISNCLRKKTKTSGGYKWNYQIQN